MRAHSEKGLPAYCAPRANRGALSRCKRGVASRSAGRRTALGSRLPARAPAEADQRLRSEGSDSQSQSNHDHGILAHCGAGPPQPRGAFSSLLPGPLPGDSNYCPPMGGCPNAESDGNSECEFSGELLLLCCGSYPLTLLVLRRFPFLRVVDMATLALDARWRVHVGLNALVLATRPRPTASIVIEVLPLVLATQPPQVRLAPPIRSLKGFGEASPACLRDEVTHLHQDSAVVDGLFDFARHRKIGLREPREAFWVLQVAARRRSAWRPTRHLEQPRLRDGAGGDCRLGRRREDRPLLAGAAGGLLWRRRWSWRRTQRPLGRTDEAPSPEDPLRVRLVTLQQVNGSNALSNLQIMLYQLALDGLAT